MDLVPLEWGYARECSAGRLLCCEWPLSAPVSELFLANEPLASGTHLFFGQGEQDEFGNAGLTGEGLSFIQGEMNEPSFLRGKIRLLANSVMLGNTPDVAISNRVLCILR